MRATRKPRANLGTIGGLEIQAWVHRGMLNFRPKGRVGVNGRYAIPLKDVYLRVSRRTTPES